LKFFKITLFQRGTTALVAVLRQLGL